MITTVDLDYAVLKLYNAIDFTLKVRLAKEHWVLISGVRQTLLIF